jgi:HD-GYP domain-containing protein (c-di-GMP phosphodiesterase class II)
MFSFEVSRIKPAEGLPFPIYLYLSLNNRFVPLRLVGDALGVERFEQFQKIGVKEFWVPEAYRQQFELHFNPVQESAPVAVPEPKLSEPAPDGVFEETELVSEVIQDEDLSQEAKAEILASLGQDLLRSFNQISNRGEEGQKEAIKRGRQIADEILAIAAQDSNIYDEILALRQSKHDIEHSIMVSTLTVMFGLAMGYSDEILLADMATAGLFHDIGLTRVDPLILAKFESQWSAQDLLRYQEHIGAGIMILKSSKSGYSDMVYKMIQQHHENYDGSGFPEQTQGINITEPSQLLHLANWFDRLASGKLDGVALSPSESLDKIFKNTIVKNGVQEVQPELIQRVFQFMLDEKEAAENLLHEANSRAQFVSETKLKTA